MFHKNLNRLIIKNIAETGHDPRIAGPPDHIKNQVVNTLPKDFVYSYRRREPKKTPVSEKPTVSSLKKRVKPISLSKF